MIDTITIILNAKMALSSKDFNLKTKWATMHQQDTNSAPKYIATVALEWPDEAKEKWTYLPEVEYINYPNPIGQEESARCYEYRITFSAPKLLNGNNIEEVSESQFDEIVDQLYEQLQFLALPTDITKFEIKRAKICRIDFSKNIMLAEHSPAKYVCSLLHRAEHKINSKYAQVQYHEGDLYRENIKYRSVVFYDKLAEFSNTTKEPSNAREQFFLSAKKARLFQVVKLEVQLQNYQQIALELERLGFEREYINFDQVFSEDIARQVLMKYWKHLIANLEPSPEQFSEENLLATFTDMLDNRGKTKPVTIFATIGFSFLVHKCGMKNIKELIYDYDKQIWDRAKAGLLLEAKYDQGVYSVLSSIEQGIKSTEPLQFGKEDENVPDFQ